MKEEKPKTGILIALGGPKMGPSGDDDDSEDMNEDEMKDATMANFISAVHAKDTGAALKAYSQLCELHEGGDDEGEKEAEGPPAAMGYK